MPRLIADSVSRVLFRNPYRIVTDKYNGYTSLLKEAGFEELRFYWPVDGYQNSRSWIDLSDNDAVKAAIKQDVIGSIKKSVLSIFTALGILRYLVPHFGIIVRKPV